MNDGTVAEHDSPDLEALFDSIVAANATPARAPATDGSEAAHGAPDTQSGEVLVKIGKLTRTLHESLRELGFDKSLQQAASAIPDTRDRLTYVATLTEKAAERALNATEVARPLQDELESGARALSANWDRLFDKQLSIDEFKALVTDTRRYLGSVPERTEATRGQLTEIMMAQDFQDLTGQVIKKITAAAHDIEHKLLELLVEQMPQEKRAEAQGLLNGPVVKHDGRTDVVANQDQVDELLESLGF
ncbi:MAG: protein phosphatase CheZ [Burkholderiales bacterium]|nr:protein phosphatase CheZ [Burkholderiales bacterium]